MKRMIIMSLALVMLTSCGAVDSSSKAPEEKTTAVETTTEAEGPVELEFREGLDEDAPLIASSEDIESAEMVALNGMDGLTYAVNIKFNDGGSYKFAEATTRLTGTDTPIAIRADGEVISAPTVNSEISNGIALITGDFTEESAMELAERINAGIRKVDE